jgi:hypothetical protein
VTTLQGERTALAAAEAFWERVEEKVASEIDPEKWLSPEAVAVLYHTSAQKVLDEMRARVRELEGGGA